MDKNYEEFCNEAHGICKDCRSTNCPDRDREEETNACLSEFLDP